MTPMTPMTARLFQAVPLAVWGGVCLYFVSSGRIASYLHPDFHAWTAVSGVALVVLALVVAAIPEAVEECCGHGPRPWLRRWAAMSVLVVPLLTTAAVSPSQFGAVAVRNRGLADSIADLPAYTPYMEPPLPTEDGSQPTGQEQGFFTLPTAADGSILASPVDLLYAAEVPEMRRDFEGREIEVVGQFFPASRNNAQGDRFTLVRMYVLCCAADARPVGVNVHISPPPSHPEMSWVKVRGIARFPTEGGRSAPLIEATTIEPTEAPEETFLY
jgi:uncharacterized repeat protein (TIGR03943 family)